MFSSVFSFESPAFHFFNARIQENHKNIGFPSNIGLDPLNIRKLPSQHSMLGYHRHASETPLKLAFRRRPNDGPLIVVLGSSLPPPPPPLINKKKKNQQKIVKVGPQNFLDPRNAFRGPFPTGIIPNIWTRIFFD